jgi:hypothetical protein
MRRDTCKVCGSEIPLIRQLTISVYTGAECPECHSHMKFSKKTYVLQILLYLLIFPTLNLMFTHKQYVLGGLLLLALVVLSISAAYFSKFIVDPAHAHRLHK